MVEVTGWWNWIWRMYMTFKDGVMLEDWMSIMIVPLDKSKGERTEFSNYRRIRLLSMIL